MEEWREELAEDDVVGDAGFAVGNGERDLDGAGELRRDIDVNLSSTYKENIQAKCRGPLVTNSAAMARI